MFDVEKIKGYKEEVEKDIKMAYASKEGKLVNQKLSKVYDIILDLFDDAEEDDNIDEKEKIDSLKGLLEYVNASQSEKALKIEDKINEESDHKNNLNELILDKIENLSQNLEESNARSNELESSLISQSIDLAEIQDKLTDLVIKNEELTTLNKSKTLEIQELREELELKDGLVTSSDHAQLIATVGVLNNKIEILSDSIVAKQEVDIINLENLAIQLCNSLNSEGLVVDYVVLLNQFINTLSITPPTTEQEFEDYL